jgi:RNA-binding protein
MLAMAPVTSRQRKQLRGLAHGLEPVVHVGKGGVTDSVVGQIDRALDSHELIKVRFVEGKQEKAELVAAIVAATGAVEAGRIGHISILYRQHADPEKRTIELSD